MLTPKDHQEIGALLDRFVEGWKQRDMTQLGSTMTEDCDWVNTVGMHWHGRPTIVKAHQILLSTRFKGVNIHGGGHQETEIAPGVVLVIWTSNIDAFTAPDGKAIPATDNRATGLLVKQDGHWLIRSFQNTPIDPAAAQHDPGR